MTTLTKQQFETLASTAPCTALVTAAHYAPAWEHLTRLDHRYGTTKAIRQVVFYELGLTIGIKQPQMRLL